MDTGGNRKRKVVSAMRNYDRTIESVGSQELWKVSELVGLALQAGRKPAPTNRQRKPETAGRNCAY